MIAHSGSLILYLRMNSVRRQSARLSSPEGGIIVKRILKIGEAMALEFPRAPRIYAIT